VTLRAAGEGFLATAVHARASGDALWDRRKEWAQTRHIDTLTIVDPAVLAVAGTLTGVLISSAAGIVLALVAGRVQRKLASTQAAHELQKAERQERRTAFVGFLDAYDSAFGLTEKIASQSEAGRALGLQEEWTEQTRRLRHTYHVLTITSSTSVREASDECLDTIWELHDSATAGDREQFLAAAEKGSLPRRKLREAMRADLGMR
jgi:hypothetical protein